MPGNIDDQNQKLNDILKYWNDLTQSKAFLSSDFLLWLWFFIESDKNPVNLSINSSTLLVKLWIEDKIVLESSGAKAHIQTLKGGEPSSSIEAGSGLISGKTVKELKLGLHIDSIGDFTVLLGSKDLSPKAIQLPSSEASGTSLDARLKLTDHLILVIDQIFLIFLQERTSETWTTATLRLIEEWIEKRGHQESHLH
jgi:hypothetical protein